jgi:ubiquinone biosynthesis accessory factor UbiJ
MFEPLATPAVNRLLRTNTWALDVLKPHAGKTVRVSCAPFTLHVTIRETGELASASAERVPDVTIALTPGLLLRAAARDDAAWRHAQVTGDVELAAAIDYVRRNLVWDYEEDLSRVFGDVAAHRMASAARQLDRWGRDTLRNLGEAGAEYATYEQPLLADRHSVNTYIEDVEKVRDDVARLEKRIAILTRRS